MQITKNQMQRVWQFALFLLRRFNEIGVPQVSGSLTFTTLLALVPVLTVMLVVVAAFPMFADVSDKFMDMVNDVLVPSGASVIMDYLNEFKTKASGLTAVSLVGMGVTSILLIQTIDQTFNRIWRVSKTRSLFQQIPIYWALLSLSPVALGLGASMTGKIKAVFPQISLGIGNLPQLLFTFALLYFAYRIVPNRYVPSKHAMCAALVTAIALELAKWGFGIYVRNFNSYTPIYGVFAAIPVFLVWLNVLWILVLTGAVLAASLSYWRGNAFLREHNSKTLFNDVIAILLQLKQAHEIGKSVSLPDFRAQIHMGYDELGDVLDKLALSGYVSQDKNQYVLKKSPDKIHLDVLAAEFVYRLPEKRSPIHAGLSELGEPFLDALDISLQEFERRYVSNNVSLLDKAEFLVANLSRQHDDK